MNFRLSLLCLACLVWSGQAMAANIELWDGTVKNGGVRYHVDEEAFNISTQEGKERIGFASVFEIRSSRALGSEESETAYAVLADGSKLAGEIVPAKDSDKIALDRGDSGIVELATDSLRSVVLSELLPGVQLEPAPKVPHLVMRSGKIIEGKVIYFTFLDVGFESVAGRIRLKRKEVHRIEMGSNAEPENGSGVVLLRTRQGDAIRGRLLSIEKGIANITHKTAGVMAFPMNDLFSIEIINKRAVSLLDLEPDKVVNKAYFDFIRPYKLNRSLFGGPLRIQGITYPSGISVHSRTELEYNLKNGFKRFVTTVGLDNTISNRGAAEFIVLADGKEVKRLTASGNSAPVQISVEVKDVMKLKLVFDFGKNGSGGDYGVWGHPRLIK